jgi:ubiquinone biosynthesis protein UbiJ
MTTEAIVWAALGGVLLILIGITGHLLRSDRDRMYRELEQLRDYARTRLHTLTNLVSGMIGRVEFREELHAIQQDIKRLEERLNDLLRGK